MGAIQEEVDLPNNVYITGYFQSENYFLPIRETLIAELTPKPNLLSKIVQSLMQEIQSQEQSVSVHITGADYIINNVDYYNLDIRHYNSAIQYLEKKHSNISYYVFTDDIAHAKKFYIH